MAIFAFAYTFALAAALTWLTAFAIVVAFAAYIIFAANAGEIMAVACVPGACAACTFRALATFSVAALSSESRYSVSFTLLPFSSKPTMVSIPFSFNTETGSLSNCAFSSGFSAISLFNTLMFFQKERLSRFVPFGLAMLYTLPLLFSFCLSFSYITFLSRKSCLFDFHSCRKFSLALLLQEIRIHS